MKKIKVLLLSAGLLGFAGYVHAQDEKVEHVGHEISKGAKKVSHKTVEVASKGKSKITDKTYRDKVGPNHETVYIDRHSRYYWVDKQGHRHYAMKSELRDKND
jgi:hypothetical protein